MSRRRLVEEGSSAPEPPGAEEAPKPVVPPRATSAIELTVTWGEELYAPVQYHSFRVGGVTLKRSLPAGSSSDAVAEAHVEMVEQLAALVERQFSKQLAGFVERQRVAAKAAR